MEPHGNSKDTETGILKDNHSSWPFPGASLLMPGIEKVCRSSCISLCTQNNVAFLPGILLMPAVVPYPLLSFIQEIETSNIPKLRF